MLGECAIMNTIINTQCVYRGSVTAPLMEYVIISIILPQLLYFNVICHYFNNTTTTIIFQCNMSLFQ